MIKIKKLRKKNKRKEIEKIKNKKIIIKKIKLKKEIICQLSATVYLGWLVIIHCLGLFSFRQTYI